MIIPEGLEGDDRAEGPVPRINREDSGRAESQVTDCEDRRESDWKKVLTLSQQAARTHDSKIEKGVRRSPHRGQVS